MKSRLIGTGSLSWFRYERVSDRYGSVNLWDEMNMVRTNVAVVYAQKLNAAKD